jgi:hypothetical protein
MAKKIKYPEIGMRDSVVDRLKKSPTAAKGTVEVSSDTSSIDMQNTKGNKTKLKSKFQYITTTSDDEGGKVLDYGIQKTGRNSKDSTYYLEMKEGTRSKLNVQKGNRERNISGTRAEKKVDRVFNRNNK